MMQYSDIILEPVLTEKTNLLRETDQKKYVFKVDARANKNQISQAIEKLFNVKPLSCRVVNVAGKLKASRNRKAAGFTSSFKKAYITLAKGQKIDVFEGV